jgi:metal-responsive CopG/Arc/MetJ family transcriptional regulator
MPMARTQTLVQLTDELLALLDQRATSLKRSRSDLIREAIQAYLADGAEAEIGRRIVEGYRRVPPEDLWPEDGDADLIPGEPW